MTIAKTVQCFACVLMSFALAAMAAESAPPAPAASAKDAQSKPAAEAAKPVIDQVCAGVVRDGWAKIDDLSDPSRCKSEEEYNVWVIERLADLPKKSALEICTVRRVPYGWYFAGGRSDPKKCRRTETNTDPNVMLIKKVY